MSQFPCDAPEASDAPCPHAIDLVIVPRTADVGMMEVRRCLPFRDKRMVGPFIFWDEMGPGEFLSGQGLDVMPHPHIGLSTVTYLLQGELMHLDSLGTRQVIAPGDVNLMSAGQGIVHSERTAQELRAEVNPLWGIQSWVAQPKTKERSTPSFVHEGISSLPALEAEGKQVRVVLGSAFGMQSPVPVEWDTLYADVSMQAGASLPVSAETEERAVYVVSGQVEVERQAYPSQQMLVLHPGIDVTITAVSDARLILLGGAVMDGPRYIWWNFVSSSREDIHEAARAWQEQRFERVPDDEDEFVPLPGMPKLSSMRE